MAKAKRVAPPTVEPQKSVPRETSADVDFESLPLEKKFEILNRENIELKLENAGLQRTVETYRENGPMRMYYALNRKSNEIADVLNKHRLSTIELRDGSDKTYDRLKSMWNDSVDLSKMVMELRKVSGATDDEEKDMKRSFDIDEFSEERK
jgi:hypothetical protein